jgi:type IV pilus assembly protein PilB
VLAQRLIRKLCPHCTQPVKLTHDQLKDSLIPQKYWSTEFHEGRGCIECNGTGHVGRTAIAEVLEMTDPVREAILNKKPAAEIKRLARSEGMHTLRESAVKRFLAGESSLKEINKMTFIEEVNL